MISNPVVGNRVYIILWHNALERDVVTAVVTDVYADGRMVTLRREKSSLSMPVMHIYETKSEAIKVCIEKILSQIKAELKELEKHERLLNATN